MTEPREDLERMAKAGWTATEGSPLWDQLLETGPGKNMREDEFRYVHAALRELVEIKKEGAWIIDPMESLSEILGEDHED